MDQQLHLNGISSRITLFALLACASATANAQSASFGKLQALPETDVVSFGRLEPSRLPHQETKISVLVDEVATEVSTSSPSDIRSVPTLPTPPVSVSPPVAVSRQTTRPTRNDQIGTFDQSSHPSGSLRPLISSHSLSELLRSVRPEPADLGTVSPKNDKNLEQTINPIEQWSMAIPHVGQPLQRDPVMIEIPVLGRMDTDFGASGLIEAVPPPFTAAVGMTAEEVFTPNPNVDR